MLKSAPRHRLGLRVAESDEGIVLDEAIEPREQGERGNEGSRGGHAISIEERHAAF